MDHLIEPLPIQEPSQVLVQLSDDMKRMSAEISGNDEWRKAAASIDGDGIGLTTIANPGWPDDHLVTDEMRGQGE